MALQIYWYDFVCFAIVGVFFCGRVVGDLTEGMSFEEKAKSIFLLRRVSGKIEASGSNGVSSLTNDMVLRGLLELFGAAFSLDQITSAYYKAGKNADDAAEALATFAPNGRETFRLPINSIYKKSPYQENGNPRASKLKYRPVSVGSVSSIIGKQYVKETASAAANGSNEATKVLEAGLQCVANVRKLGRKR
ncbi:hypothetical protein TB2_031317 [Malus domestica]